MNRTNNIVSLNRENTLLDRLKSFVGDIDSNKNDRREIHYSSINDTHQSSKKRTP